MIIDAQHHAMPRNVFEKFHDPSLPPKRVFIKDNDFVFAPRLCLIEEHLQAMDEAGVDMALLSMSQFGNLMGKDICREINEGFAEIAVKYPNRFIIAGCFPQDNTESALAEIEYQIKTLKFPAITMLTSLSPEINLSNRERMFPIYQKALELDIPIFLHPHLKPFGMELECTINRTLGRGLDSAKAALRVIYDIFPSYPDLKFVLPHFGGATFALKGRMCNFFEPWDALGLPPAQERYKNLAKSPLESEELGYTKVFNELFDKLYIDGAGSGGWPIITEMAFKAARHDHLLWGTDYPYEIHDGRDLKYYINTLDSLDIPESSKKGFLGDNLAKLLKLTV
ncbi:MAG: amidohydrolase [Clostridiales Family XIII bacterium]|jgi:predicted TIM-barrel fold metal-dependent hydrolase|nr:amidohydrolase [Clostridiales Family XIII bacterium]